MLDFDSDTKDAEKRRPLIDQLIAADRYVQRDPQPDSLSVPEPDSARDAVVMLASAADAESQLLVAALNRAGVPAIILDPRTLASSHVWWDVLTGELEVDGVPLSPAVLWARRLRPIRSNAPAQLELQRFECQSWQAAVSQIQLASRSVVNQVRPALLEQITAVASAGVSVPQTLVIAGDSPSRLPPWSRVVVKAVQSHFIESAPGAFIGAFPEIYSIEDFERVKLSGTPPLIVQEFIPHDTELRTYWMAGRVVTFEVVKPSPAALWTAESEVTITQCAPTEAVSHAAARVAAALGIDYAAIDFLVSDGEITFLEANLDGDWLWFESQARSRSVTKAILDMLYMRRHQALAEST